MLRNSRLYRKLFRKKNGRTDRIGIAIVDNRPDNLPILGRRATHCNMVAKARQGNVFYAEGRNYSCGFAIYTLGFSNDLPAFQRSLTKNMKRIRNALKVEVCEKLIESTPRLPEGEKYTVCFPLDKMPLEPDVVLIIGDPTKIMNLVWEISSKTGERLQASIGAIGAMCGELTVQTMVTGKPNLSVGCCGSRQFGQLDNDEIILSLPWEQYRTLFNGSA